MITQFLETRKLTETLCEPLIPEDYVMQSMADVSPPKWHLGHTTWFFEHFVLSAFLNNYEIYRPEFNYLFNSYYKSAGEHLPRCRRGILSRPSIKEVYLYRREMTDRVCELLQSASETDLKKICPVLELGLHHEQQHQELLLTDMKHIFWSNPLRPNYLPNRISTGSVNPITSEIEKKDGNLSSEILIKAQSQKIQLAGGMNQIGYNGKAFAFDNERPRHKVYLEDFTFGSRLVTNGEFLEFIEAGGYQNPTFWLSDGWNWIEKQGWNAPLYWEKQGNQWLSMTLLGMASIVQSEPVCHVSFYEARAFAQWKNARLPTEAEWETTAESIKIEGNFLEDGFYHPVALQHLKGIEQLYGDVWEWTESSYVPYPNFQPWSGSIGEYNGKFMCNQMVLRGGSCVTPKSHIRSSYRNFFPPEARWQFSGFRLAGI